ncbi:MAG: glycosyltransferase family 2 protein [Planctomycetota bacterium]|nr:MAG: glycosyltransferase family 2 protein [Planctomycetota bacterium]
MRQALARTAVVIPARDEQEGIVRVLRDLPAVGVVIVVDNGSRDETARRAAALGAEVVHEPVAGYGRACLRGLRHLDERYPASVPDAPQWVAFLDADHADDPRLLPELVEPLAQDEADFVLGTRLKGACEPGALPPQVRWGNRLAVWLMARIWGFRYSDLGPFRVIRRAALERLQMTDLDFGWTVEMQVKAVLHGLRIVELPVPYRRRIGRSKISGTVAGTVRAGTKILYTIARYAWKTRGVPRAEGIPQNVA